MDNCWSVATDVAMSACLLYRLFVVVDESALLTCDDTARKDTKYPKILYLKS